MGIFGAIGKAITGPFRAIGKVFTGDFKGALGAFGDTLKMAAPFIPGVGIPAGIALAAAGGGLQTLDDPNQSAGSWLKNIAGGAAVGGLGTVGKLFATAPGKVGGFLPGPGGTSIPLQGPSLLSKIGGVAGKVGKYALDKPELAGQVLGMGADVYAGGKANDQYMMELAFRQEQEMEARKQRDMQMMMQYIAAMRPRY